MVIFLFLRNFWATIIPAVTVPLSLVGTFAVLYELGYTLDNLSLMALSIAVGFVVDDAVVVIENIVRHLEEGASPLEAALKGAGEIGFTIVSITLSLIAVFIPLFLMSGYVGLLFREFAVTVSVALVLSLLISLTLTPMMCARLLKSRSERHGRLYRLSERGFDGLLHLYEAGLKIVLRHRFVTLMVMLGTIVLTGYLYVVIPKGFFPQQDTGLITRPVRGRAGHLLFGHGPASAGRDRRGAGGSGGRIGRLGDRCRRRHHHGQQRPRVHRAQAPRRARRHCGSGDSTAANATRPHPGDHSLHAGCAGHHDRRAAIQDPVSIYVGRRRPRRAQSLGPALPRQDQGRSRHHRRHYRPGECRAIARYHGQSRGCVEFRNPALDDRQYTRRCVRSAHRFDHVYAAQPVPCGA